MNDHECRTSLVSAKRQFVTLLHELSPAEGKDFLDWIIEQHSSLRNDDTTLQESCISNAFEQCVNAEESLHSIIEDIRNRVPLSGTCASEVILKPEVGQNSDCDPRTTVVVDSFLYDDDDIDMLCDQNQFSRNYCTNCGCHNTAPLTIISHSMSIMQMKYIFKSVLPRILPDVSNATLIDIGSRLGAVLYGAYYFSKFGKIVGIEMNKELCHLQNEVIQKYALGMRIQTICNDVCNVGELLKQANVILLNNTFEFFLERNAQISTWKNIRHHISHNPGCILVTVPSLEESVCIENGGQPIYDINSWLIPLNVNPDELGIGYSEDELDEISNIHFYKVK